MAEPKPFRVALTADFYNADGSTKFPDLGLSVFEPHEHIAYAPFAEHRKQIGSDQLKGFNGVIVLTPAVTSDTVSNAENLLAVGRFGVGYDAVDVKACTDADVVAFITPGAVDRPVAVATQGWMIALTHNNPIKDRLVSTSQWEERSK
jgi:phosphoglycerate dehydrogenase-like enzyme